MTKSLQKLGFKLINGALKREGAKTHQSGPNLFGGGVALSLADLRKHFLQIKFLTFKISKYVPNFSFRYKSTNIFHVSTPFVPL